MLLRLAIRDFVLVDRLELEFQRGFSVLTGETGAGKSILIDALAAVLGERTDSGVVRTGCERAEISAEFSSSDPAIAEWLNANDFARDETLLLRRVIDAGGRSRAYLNGSPATAQQLREIAEYLIDIHGQHAHQSLLRSDAQRQLLDAHGGHQDLVRRVGQTWQTWREAAQRLHEATQAAGNIENEREELAWKIGELETLALETGEWERINQEQGRLAHAANLIDGIGFLLATLAENDEGNSQLAILNTAIARLDTLSEFDPSLQDIAALVQSAHAELSEAASMLRRYSDRLDLDPARLAEIDARIAAVLACARKFRATPEQLPGLLDEWRVRTEALTAAADLQALQAEVDRAEKNYLELATQLSGHRRTTAETLGQAVSELMQQLALGNGRFEVALLPLTGNGNACGLEQIEFRVAGLAQDEARPLARVASGGEISRIGLAIQVVTSRAAHVPTLVFDEVDVGIGGGVAEVVGRLLRDLGHERQVLCVTHLPQVAARAEWQWQVSKSDDSGQEGGIRSRVESLDANGRIEEIARMLGGVKITPVTRQHAMEMLGLTKNIDQKELF